MSQDIQRIFTEVENRAKHVVDCWRQLRADMESQLPESYHPEIQALSQKLEDPDNSALQTLLGELSQPTLTLATTGTTSGGKSSLVNLLCGAEIMPVAVSEMSAGIVTIEYGPETVLVIPQTPDATWEWGEWQGLKDSEIQRRLHDVMLAFIDGRKERPDLACPQFYIRYPLRLHSLLELPSNTKIRILDLPGLASMGDEGNREIITSQAGQALCLVTYNSAETDQQKINKLLSEVVGEVKKLGGSPARMLFILNRIDVFRTDNTWPASEKRATTQRVDSIKSQLKEYLVEYKEEIEALQVVKLSTLPALFSLQIRSAKREISNQACTRAETDFKRLIGDDILDDLPRKQESWQAYDRERVAQKLWLNSYGGQFDEALRKHVEENFPQLVLPQLITEFKEEGANAAVQWGQQTVQAVLNSSQEKYEQEVTNLNLIRDALNQSLEESARELKSPFENLVGAGSSEFEISDAVETLPDKIREIPRYQNLGDRLQPIRGWRLPLQQNLNECFESVSHYLESGGELDALAFQSVNYEQMRKLDKDLRDLIQLGYRDFAKNGGVFEAKTDREKTRLRDLNESLNQLGDHLSRVIEKVIVQTCETEFRRTQKALLYLFEYHLSEVQAEVTKIAPNYGIKFPSYRLSLVDAGEVIPKVRLESGFPIKSTQYEEYYQVEKEKRVWYKLWIGKKRWQETRYETRPSDTAEIPSAEELLTNWSAQSRQAYDEVMSSTYQWFLRQADSLNTSLVETNQDILERYKERLDAAHAQIELNQQEEEQIWQPLKQKLEDMNQQLSSLKLSEIINRNQG